MAQPVIFFTSPETGRNKMLFDALAGAAENLGATLLVSEASSVIRDFRESVKKSSVVVCDTATAGASALYQVGVADALRKPLVFLSPAVSAVPFDISGFRYLLYDYFSNAVELRSAIQDIIAHALKEPTFGDSAPSGEAHNVFISYSHVDREVLDRLLVHLRPLEKEKLIATWADTRLSPGSLWKSEITTALDKSKIAVLLISADFLASDFIVENELPPLLKAAKDKGTIILPVIVTHCRFARDPSLREFQAINDPKKPLTSLSKTEQELLFDRIAEAIEKALHKTDR